MAAEHITVSPSSDFSVQSFNDDGKAKLIKDLLKISRHEKASASLRAERQEEEELGIWHLVTQAAAVSDTVEKTFTPLPLRKNIRGASATPHVREPCPDPVQGLEWEQDCFQG